MLSPSVPFFPMEWLPAEGQVGQQTWGSSHCWESPQTKEWYHFRDLGVWGRYRLGWERKSTNYWARVGEKVICKVLLHTLSKEILAETPRKAIVKGPPNGGTWAEDMSESVGPWGKLRPWLQPPSETVMHGQRPEPDMGRAVFLRKCL